MYIVHTSNEQPPSHTTWTHAVRLVEEEFSNLDSTPVSREQFMNVLVYIDSIYIQATYEDKSLETRCRRVRAERAVRAHSRRHRRAPKYNTESIIWTMLGICHSRGPLLLLEAQDFYFQKV